MQRDEKAFSDKLKKAKINDLQQAETKIIISDLARLIQRAARMSQGYQFTSYINQIEPNKTPAISAFLAYAILMIDELQRRDVTVNMKDEQAKLYDDVNGVSKHENEDIGYNANFYSALLADRDRCIDLIGGGTLDFKSLDEYMQAHQSDANKIELIKINSHPLPGDMKACLRMIKQPLPLTSHANSTSVIQAVVMQDPAPLPPRAKKNADVKNDVKKIRPPATMPKKTKNKSTDVLQEKPINTLREEIRQQIASIKKDGNYQSGMYAIGFADDDSRYQHKLNVLRGVLDYIDGKINIAALTDLIEANPKYDKSLKIGRSKTGKLLDKAIEQGPNNEKKNDELKERRPRKSR